MSIICVNDNGDLPYGYKEFWIDNDEEIENVTKKCSDGSICISRSSGNLFIFGVKRKKEWDLFMGE